jgi:hypothetical protein
MTYEQDSGTPKDFSCLGHWQWMKSNGRSRKLWNDGVVDAECCS